MTIEDISNNSNFVDAPGNEVIIKVIGVGGGGNNAVNHMYEQGIDKVSFVVCNTDRQALNNSPIQTRVLIGPKTTRGLGAGNKPERAREAAEESADDIAALFNDETKMVFITAGMGGGTGTGAAPIVARIARDRGLLTIGIVTIPFLFEGNKKILKALDGAEEMSKYVDALLVVNNEQLTEIYPDLDWMNAFGKADDTLANAARSISELITCDGYMNLDFEDVNTTLRDGGAAIISTGYGEGEHRVSKAIDDALHSPLLKNRDINGSKKLLFNLYYSREADIPFVMGEAKELTSFISNIDPGVDVIYGIGFDETLGNKIKITILAAGFELTIKGVDKKPVINKGNSTGVDGGHRSPFRAAHNDPAPQPREEDETLDAIKNAYGEDKVNSVIREREAVRYIVLRPDQLDDDAIIETLEHNPAYNRDKRIADEVRNTGSSAGYPRSDRQATIPSTTDDSASQGSSADRDNGSAPQKPGNSRIISF